jgi:uncharacterized membrane protein
MSKHHNSPAVIHHEQRTTYSGPIPHPDDLQKYEVVCPGAAERILRMAEQQSEHRRSIETIVIQSNVQNSRLGLLFGVTMGLASLVIAGFCTYIGYPNVGGIIGGTGMTALVSVFVIGSKNQKDERLQKERMMLENK